MTSTYRFRAHGVVITATACAVLLAGCGGDRGYFRVRDPVVETTYYTTRIATDHGALRFKDEQSGNTVRLQSSEVKKISKQEFMKGASTPAPTAAVPAPAPALTVGAQMPAGAGASTPPAAGASAAKPR